MFAPVFESLWQKVVLKSRFPPPPLVFSPLIFVALIDSMTEKSCSEPGEVPPSGRTIESCSSDLLKLERLFFCFWVQGQLRNVQHIQATVSAVAAILENQPKRGSSILRSCQKETLAVAFQDDSGVSQRLLGS